MVRLVHYTISVAGEGGFDGGALALAEGDILQAASIQRRIRGLMSLSHMLTVVRATEGSRNALFLEYKGASFDLLLLLWVVVFLFFWFFSFEGGGRGKR